MYTILVNGTCQVDGEILKDMIICGMDGKTPFSGDLEQAKDMLKYMRREFGKYGVTYKLYELVEK